MYKVWNIVVKLVLLGIFFLPSELLACAVHTTTDTTRASHETVVGTKMSSSTHHESSFCGNACCADGGEGSRSHGDCCQFFCQGPCHILLLAPLEKQSYTMLICKDKHSYPVYRQPQYPSGEFSIWLPPKIG
ncbi:hypothetical protein [Myroides odoratus]|uniref:hypothetical protein n=1 Tax=Myroides odoratus TaxID=256 RepID=UPI00333F1DE8